MKNMLNNGLLIVEPSKLCGGLDYLTKFNPKRYLQTYYSDMNPNEFDAELMLMPFHVETLFYIFNSALKEKLSNKNARLLDVGSGPSVHVPLCSSKVFRDIYLSDLVDGSRYECKKWLEYDGDAFDWSSVAKYVGDMENVVDEVITERAREKVKDVLECNIKDEKVIREPLGKFDVVSCMFCLETASDNHRQYQTCARNVINMVKPNGYVVISGLLHNVYYNAGGCVFRTLNLNKQQVMETLDICGIDIEEWFEFQTPFCEVNHPRTSLCAVHYVCYGKKRP